MNRLQRKCFIASAAMHLLLLILLLVAPAFVAHEEKLENVAILTFIPSKLVDDPFSGGGTPRPAPPPPREVQPDPPKREPPREEIQQPPPTPKLVEPEPPKRVETKKPEKVSPPRPKPKPKPKIVPNLKLVRNTAKQEAEERARKEEAQRLKARRDQLLAIQQNLQKKFSKSTDIQPLGPGGEAYANYNSVVITIYERAWHPPDGLDANSGTVKVKVVIARSGKVLSAEITRQSGDRLLDQSVERALRAVRQIAPFPKGTRDLQRTFIIDFNYNLKGSR